MSSFCFRVLWQPEKEKKKDLWAFNIGEIRNTLHRIKSKSGSCLLITASRSKVGPAFCTYTCIIKCVNTYYDPTWSVKGTSILKSHGLQRRRDWRRKKKIYVCSCNFALLCWFYIEFIKWFLSSLQPTIGHAFMTRARAVGGQTPKKP